MEDLIVIGLSLVVSMMAITLASPILYVAAGLGWLTLLRCVKNDLEN